MPLCGNRLADCGKCDTTSMRCAVHVARITGVAHHAYVIPRQASKYASHTIKWSRTLSCRPSVCAACDCTIGPICVGGPSG